MCVCVLEWYYGFMRSLLWKLTLGQSVSGSPRRLGWALVPRSKRPPRQTSCSENREAGKFLEDDQGNESETFYSRDSAYRMSSGKWFDLIPRDRIWTPCNQTAFGDTGLCAHRVVFVAFCTINDAVFGLQANNFDEHYGQKKQNFSSSSLPHIADFCWKWLAAAPLPTVDEALNSNHYNLTQQNKYLSGEFRHDITF